MGLMPVPDCTDVGGTCECPDTPLSLCAPCGDGTCDASESACTCPADCSAAENECVTGGGFCREPISGGKPCPPGHTPISRSGCLDDQIGCTESS